MDQEIERQFHRCLGEIDHAVKDMRTKPLGDDPSWIEPHLRIIEETLGELKELAKRKTLEDRG